MILKSKPVKIIFKNPISGKKVEVCKSFFEGFRIPNIAFKRSALVKEMKFNILSQLL